MGELFLQYENVIKVFKSICSQLVTESEKRMNCLLGFLRKARLEVIFQIKACQYQMPGSTPFFSSRFFFSFLFLEKFGDLLSNFNSTLLTFIIRDMFRFVVK